MSRRKRTHVFAVRLHFDRPCTQDDAVAAARDCIHGEFYPGVYSSDPKKLALPDEMKVGGFSTVRDAAKRLTPDALPKPLSAAVQMVRNEIEDLEITDA